MKYLKIVLSLIILILISAAVYTGYLVFTAVKIKKAKDQIALIGKGIQYFYMDSEQYPQTLSDLVVDPPGWVIEKGPEGYLGKGVTEIPVDPWGNAFVYRYPSTSTDRSFDLFCYGTDGKEGGKDKDADIHFHLLQNNQ